MVCRDELLKAAPPVPGIAPGQFRQPALPEPVRPESEGQNPGRQSGFCRRSPNGGGVDGPVARKAEP